MTVSGGSSSNQSACSNIAANLQSGEVRFYKNAGCSGTTTTIQLNANETHRTVKLPSVGNAIILGPQTGVIIWSGETYKGTFYGRKYFRKIECDSSSSCGFAELTYYSYFDVTTGANSSNPTVLIGTNSLSYWNTSSRINIQPEYVEVYRVGGYTPNISTPFMANDTTILSNVVPTTTTLSTSAYITDSLTTSPDSSTTYISSTGEEGGGEGLSWWIWFLIAIGVSGVVVAGSKYYKTQKNKRTSSAGFGKRRFIRRRRY